MTEATNTQMQDFPSFEALRSAHAELLRQQRQETDPAAVVPATLAFLERLQATGTHLDDDGERQSAQSLLDYWSTKLFRLGVDVPPRILAEFDENAAPEIPDEKCPYRGLSAFTEGDSADFFGREKMIEGLVEHIRTGRLLAVVGPSGSGKSSVVRAGLIPALQRGAFLGSESWVFLPSMVPGSRPLENLAHLFRPPQAGQDWDTAQAIAFQADPQGLLKLVTAKYDQPVILVVDQFEEIFTLCEHESSRQAFVANLVALVKAQPLRHSVILTMRTDFESKLPLLGEFQGLVENNIQRVPPLNAAELRRAIEEPARRVGLKFESGVVEALLNDILGEPAALPLLQFTLLKLWEERRRNRITWESFRHLGGARQALATSADEFLRSLIPEEQAAARQILMRLVQPGEGLEITSRRLRREDLYSGNFARERVDRVLQQFLDERLLRLTRGDRPQDDQIEVAHEALIRNWPTLTEWYQEELDSLKDRRRLTAAAENWERLNHDPAALLRGSMLEQMRNFTDLTREEMALIQASLQAEQAYLRRERRRRQIIAVISVAAVLFGIFASIASIVATGAARTANQALTTATVALGNAQVQAAIATNALGLVQQQANDLQLALTQASEQKQYAEEQQATATSALALYATQVVAANEAQQAANVQDLLVQALSVSSSQTDLGLLLALEANRLEDNEAVSADVNRRLLDVLQANPRLLTYFHPGTGPIYSLAFDPASGLLVTSSEDGSFFAWDTDERRAVPTDGVVLAGPVRSVSTSQGGLLAVGGCDRTVPETGQCQLGGGRVLDSVESGNTLFELYGHSNAITALAFSDDESLLVSGSSDTLILWDVASGKPVTVLPGNTVIALGRGSTVARASGTNIIIDPLSTFVRSTMDYLSNELTIQLSGEHSAPVTVLAFSPDGRYLASGGQDHRVVIWDLSGARRPVRLERHTLNINQLAFNPDGSLLASAGGEGAVILWRLNDILNANAETRLASEVLAGHTDAALGLGFNPQGTMLATSGRDGAVLLWDMTGSSLVSQSFPPVYTSPIQALSFPDANTLMAAWINGILKSLDVSESLPSGNLSDRPLSELLEASWTQLDTFNLPENTQAVLSSPDGTRHALVPIDVIGVVAGPGDPRVNWSSTRDARLSFGYTWVADGLQPNPFFVQQWEAMGNFGLLRGVVVRYQPGIEPVAYTNLIDEQLFQVSGRLPFDIHLGFGHTNWLFPRSAPGAILGMEIPPAVLVDDLQKTDPQGVLPELGALLEHMAVYYGITPLIYTSPALWNQVVGQSPDQAPPPQDQPDLASHYPLMVVDPSGANNPTLPAGWHDWAFWEFSPAGGSHPAQAELPLPLVRFNGSPSLLSTYFASLDTGETVVLGRRATLVELRQGKLFDQGQEFPYTPGSSAALSPDKATLALGLADGHIEFVDTASGAVRDTLTLGPAGAVTSLAYSPDGVFLAAGYEDATIAVWDINLGFPSGNLTGHTSPVLSLAFSASGRVLASGSADGNIILWDVPAMRSLAGPLLGRPAQVTALAFHPSDRYLFSGSAKGDIDFWLVDPQDWLEMACLRAGRNLTQAEFARYFIGQRYRLTCEQYPAGK